MTVLPTALIKRLEKIVGRDATKTHPLELHVFGKDAGVERGDAAVVVLPADADEVAEIVRACVEFSVPIVPRGAGTGLAGGAVPEEPAVLLVTTRMNEIQIDVANRTAWVGPGVINLDLSNHTASLGLHFAPDPSSQAACTIGGNVANNSGGPHCLAEGTTVDHVLALEYVTPSGETVIVGSAAPDPTGFDLRGVIVGSEGTLGVVTRALVRLIPNPPAVRTLLMAFPEVSGAAATVSDVIAAGVVPAALEMMDQRLTEAVERFVHAGLPLDAAAVLLAEVAGHPVGAEAEADMIEEIALRNGAFQMRRAADEDERQLLWKARKSAFGAIAQVAPDYYLHDTVIPRTKLVEVLERIYEISDRYELTVLNTIHAGDGNLHPLFAFDGDDPAAVEAVKRAADEIVEVSIEAGGMLSGEHGIGMEKRDLMPLVFSELDLDAQARLRDALDPEGIMNPAKILPQGSRCFDFGRPVPDGVWV
jgi:glycolate oxidase